MRRLLLGLLALPLLAQADASLRFCAAGSPKTFDPTNTDSGVDTVAIIPVYSGLVTMKRGTDEVVPALAESWSVSADGLQFTFDLRPGVAFQTTEDFKPTRALNADDVLFTFDRLLNRPGGLGGAFAKAVLSTRPYVLSFGWDKLIGKVEKLAPLKVRFTLTQRDGAFLTALTQVFASIESAEYAAQLLQAGKPERIAVAPVGTGPYQLKSFRADAVVRYVKHPNWFRKGEVPQADQLVYAITPDGSVRAQRLRRDECDIAAPVGPADLAELRKDPGIKIASAPGMNVGFLAYNTRHPVLSRLEVRQALDMALDKAALLKTVYGEGSVMAQSVIPVANWAYDASLRAAPHDPAKAKALLQKAGVLPLQLDLWAIPVVRAYNPNGQLMAQMIQADWAKIGVQARIVTYEWGEYLRRIDKGESDVAMIGWNGDPEPAGTFGQLACGAMSGSFWCNPEYDKLLAEGRAGLTREARKSAYAKAQRLVMQELPWSPIAHGAIAVPMRASVKGFIQALDGQFYFDGVLPK